MKPNKLIFIVISLVVIGLIVFYFVKRNRAAAAENSANSNATPGSQNLSGWPLQKYVINAPAVRKLQTALNTYYNQGLDIDGIFGDLTEEALYKVTGLKDVLNEKELNSLISLMKKSTETN